jgi:integrase/recombinase XerD
VFETLFQYSAVVARHRDGPFAEARERFLNHCDGQGLARATLQRYAQELLVVAERIDITIGEAIGSSTIETAADRWAREQRQRQRVRSLRWSRELFVQTATDWLHFLGRLEVPKPKMVPFADRLADFVAYRRDERGLSPPPFVIRAGGNRRSSRAPQCLRHSDLRQGGSGWITGSSEL